MRINKFLSSNTNLSRRSSDKAIEDGRVEINGITAKLGDVVVESDKLYLDGNLIVHKEQKLTIIINKPVGYVVSKNGQGSKTIYDLLPIKFHTLNPVGRLDKDSSGLLIMTNDGDFNNSLSHPSFNKSKVYFIELDKTLDNKSLNKINSIGVDISDKKPSKFKLESASSHFPKYKAILTEGRNRQIRRTFEALGYKVKELHRTEFGPFKLGRLPSGKLQIIDQ